MAFDFEQIFKDALNAGVKAASPGGEAARKWIKQSAKANQDSLSDIVTALQEKRISKATAEMLLKESARALDSEAAALSVILKVAAQAAVNAFIGSLQSALSSALKLAL